MTRVEPDQRHTRDHKDVSKYKYQGGLYRLARELLEQVDPDYALNGDFVVQFACTDDAEIHFVKKHTDSHDVSHQYILGLGDYAGGELRCHNGDTHTDLDIKCRLWKVDGRLPHEVLPFKGTRFTVIWFKNYDRRQTRVADVQLQPAEVQLQPADQQAKRRRVC